ncbi:MAG TPA: hypothetical protein VK879_01795, partial [Candidatus Sulfomarinibacteraceae bacterium]|nr:hypothetical protein [Candidatus Sulfomarinibacteraceae bacterium]
MYTQFRYSRLLYLALPLIALVLGACGVAELSPQFSHQGRLLDGDGNPVPDGNYNVEYRLFQQSSGGTAVYTDTQTVSVENGLFTTSIGASDEITPSIFSEPTWMELTIDGETLTPRQRLQGAPYAFSLVPDAVVQGSVPITRTFQGQDNTGAAMTVFNTDSSATGGNGLVVVNAASPAFDTPDPRQNVAALQAIATGGSANEGGYGAIIRAEQYRGLYAKGATNFYAAVFDSNIGIQITGGGNCNGCALAYPAQNVGNTAIEKGDLVAVSGVMVDEEFDIPVMQVYKATSAEDPIVGVATQALERNPMVDVAGARMGGYEGMDGPADAGGYLSVVVEGLVQVKASS